MRRTSLAWTLALAYTLLVILFGAVVRITGSGAGCGQHWPSCHGEVTHLPQTLETAIELTHRVTSGLSLLVVFALAIWTYRTTARGQLVRRAALWACVFMVSESLVGAALVLLSLVGQNDSWQRALVMTVHLVNTSLLTLAMLVASYALRRADLQLDRTRPGAGRALLCLGAVLFVSAAGAVTALGDTVYPVSGESPLVVAAQSTDELSHFLQRLRGVHPLAALGAALFILLSLEHFSAAAPRRWVLALTLAQVGAGFLNIWLSAPGWMQVLHLALATGLWLALGSVFLEQASGAAQSKAQTLASSSKLGTVGS